MNEFYFLIISIFFFMTNTTEIIFDFNTTKDISNWRIIDDVVMGGKSEGKFTLNKDGNGVFSGNVSLENNGGFSSLRYRNSSIKIKNYKNIVLKIKGDGKNYQFRIKDDLDNYFSYVFTFKTGNDWQTITIPLSEMYPSFRGRKLQMDNFSSEKIEEIAFLIGNKKEQSFKLEINKIYLH